MRWESSRTRPSLLRTAKRILQLPETQLSAFVFVLGVGVLIAVWVLWPPEHRSGFVEETALAATVLGFLVAVITLLGTARETRDTHAPPDFSVEWLTQTGGDGDWVPLQLTGKDGTKRPPTGLSSRFEVSSTLKVINKGVRTIVPAVSMTSEVRCFHDDTAPTEPKAFETKPDERKLSPFFKNREDTGWDLAWEQDLHSPQWWATTKSVTLTEDQEIWLPLPFTLRVVDADLAEDLLHKSDVVKWTTYLVFHTSRGDFTTSLEKILANEEDWVAAGRPKKWRSGRYHEEVTRWIAIRKRNAS